MKVPVSQRAGDIPKGQMSSGSISPSLCSASSLMTSPMVSGVARRAVKRPEVKAGCSAKPTTSEFSSEKRRAGPS